MYRRHQGDLEVFLVHPGGPFWANKDIGAWSIPKGEYAEGEQPLQAAQREFQEETSFIATGIFLELGTIRQTGGKIVTAWAFEGDCDPTNLRSNVYQTEWPPRSGGRVEFPEVDRARWFSIPQAREHILKSQEPLLDALCRVVHFDGK
jgi:predicted NUDIX family NTP pyrophosphohydrolase